MHVRSLDCTEDELLSIAATIEEYSNHPIAKAITAYAKEHQTSIQSGTDFRAIVGKGAQVTIDGETYYAEIKHYMKILEFRFKCGTSRFGKCKELVKP